eukprot:2810866-Rhodomonas_salina.3
MGLRSASACLRSASDGSRFISTLLTPGSHQRLVDCEGGCCVRARPARWLAPMLQPPCTGRDTTVSRQH